MSNSINEENVFLDSDLARETWISKYKIESDKSIEDQWKRNAIAVASVEKKEDQEKWAKKFYEILYGFRFCPGGRIQLALGHPSNRVSASNCYVADIADDSLEEIYNTLKIHGLTYASTGGIGTDISILRPYGEKIAGSRGESPGAVSFMDLYSINCNTIAQKGRRGALMLMMYVHHPDIEKFINIKNDYERTKVKHANISVKITDEFMRAVKEDKNFDLCWPCTPEHEAKLGKKKKIYRTIKARDLWKQITEMANKNAEPGIVFWDRMTQYHNGEQLGLKLHATNPCLIGSDKLLTENGYIRLDELANSVDPLKIGTDERVLKTGLQWANFVSLRDSSNVFKTKNQAHVFKVVLENGYEVTATLNHEFPIPGDFIRAKLEDLKIGDELLIQPKNGFWRTSQNLNGVFFLDRDNRSNLYSKIKEISYAGQKDVYCVDQPYSNSIIVNGIVTGNCGEIPLPNSSNCNLGHINLEKYILAEHGEQKSFDFQNFKKDIKIAVRFMDNVIDYNKERHATKEQREQAIKERRIGLGITGLGNMLIRMGIKYDSQKALDLIEEISKAWMEESYDASIELAKERGSFPAYNFEGYSKSKFFEGLSEKIQKKIADNGIRNVTLNTIAPVGTVSIVAETSSGIEPVFAFWYDRFVKQDDGDSRKKYRVYERIFREFKKLGIFAADNQLPEYMVTSHQIDPYFRIKMQSIWQRYCDNAISSTVNLPKETSVETVQKIYEYAYEMGLKGITVYREGSREGVLVTDAAKEEEYVGHPPVVGGGTTYKVPIRTDSNLYVTIHPREDNEQLPYCIFINSNNMEINARTMGLAILLSSVFQTTRQEMLRKRIDEILSNFKNIEDSSVGAWYEGKRIKSVEHAISIILKKFMGDTKEQASVFSKCPNCSQRTFVVENGCSKCINAECDYISKCG